MEGAQAVAELLRRSRFEVLPLDGIEAEVLAHLGTDVTVTVTASPSRGLDATLDLSERLVREGYEVVPHLSARLIRDRAHLDEMLDRLLAAGVRELFVPAGDAEAPAGEFEAAADLLEAMGPRRSEFEAIDITGYPESHHLISDEETIRAMFAKAPMATHIISQICFDAPTILDWIAKVRARGTGLPIWIGMPGTVDRTRLMRITMQIGLGESARFLRHHGNWIYASLDPPVQARPPAARPHSRGRGPGPARGRLSPLLLQRGGADGTLAPRGAGAARRVSAGRREYRAP